MSAFSTLTYCVRKMHSCVHVICSEAIFFSFKLVNNCEQSIQPDYVFDQILLICTYNNPKPAKDNNFQIFWHIAFAVLP